MYKLHATYTLKEYTKIYHIYADKFDSPLSRGVYVLEAQMGKVGEDHVHEQTLDEERINLGLLPSAYWCQSAQAKRARLDTSTKATEKQSKHTHLR